MGARVAILMRGWPPIASLCPVGRQPRRLNEVPVLSHNHPNAFAEEVPQEVAGRRCL
jgi:hypothetical protein